MAKHSKSLNKLIDALGPFYDLLTDPLLTTRERHACAATFYDQAPQFVNVVAQVLRDDAPVFRDIPIDPTELLDLQDEADLLRILRSHLEILAKLCGDGYFRAQSTSLSLANSAYRRVLQDTEILFNIDPRMQKRAAAMSKADLHAPNRTGGRKRRRNKGALTTPVKTRGEVR